MMQLSVTKRVLTAMWAALAVIPAMVFSQGVTPSTNYGVVEVASTVPPNGDLNPYGVAIVPRTMENWFQATFWSAILTIAPTYKGPARRL